MNIGAQKPPRSGGGAVTSKTIIETWPDGSMTTGVADNGTRQVIFGATEKDIEDQYKRNCWYGFVKVKRPDGTIVNHPDFKPEMAHLGRAPDSNRKSEDVSSL